MSRRPLVTVSYAQSLDGRIATRTGDSRWISGAGALRLAHRLRRDNDAILVGIGTVLRDDPELTCRLVRGASPRRVVLDSTLRLPAEAAVVRTAREVPTLVFTGTQSPPSRPELEAAGVRIVPAASGGGGHVRLPEVLDRLAAEGVRALFVEGGSQVITAFLREGLADRLLVVVAPLLIGQGVAAVGDLGVESLAEALRPRRQRMRRLGRDLLWELELR